MATTQIAQELSRIETAKDILVDKAIAMQLKATDANGNEVAISNEYKAIEEVAEAIDNIVVLDTPGSVNIKVSETGVISAEQAYVPSYVKGSGTRETTKNLSTVEGRIVTPVREQQTVAQKNVFTLGAIKVDAIPDYLQDTRNVTATSGDVKAGTKFLASDGVLKDGTMADNSSFSGGALYLDRQYVTIPEGYHSGSGTVYITPESAKDVTPGKNDQTISPEVGKVLSTVKVLGDTDLDPKNIRDGVTIFGVEGTFSDAYADECEPATRGDILVGRRAYVQGVGIDGSMPSNGDVSAEFDALSQTRITIPEGYALGGDITLNSNLLNRLKAI